MSRRTGKTQNKIQNLSTRPYRSHQYKNAQFQLLGMMGSQKFETAYDYPNSHALTKIEEESSRYVVGISDMPVRVQIH